MDATVNASLVLLLEQLNDSSVTPGETAANVTKLTVVDTVTNVTAVTSGVTSRSETFTWRYILPLYCVILALSVTGNSIVIITLAQNRRIRTVTNVYLLNLAVSDLMLGVFCVPFTLLGQLLRRFVFGAALCKLIPFLQAVSVCVDVWTLVAISLERYFAICRPLASRRWQTQGHAAHVIALVWSLAALACAPILLASQLQRIASRNHSYKCREMWSSVWLERAFNLFLDVVLLPVPFSIMLIAYCLIARKLSTGMKHEMKHCQRQLDRTLSCSSQHGQAYHSNGGSQYWLARNLMQVSESAGASGEVRAVLLAPNSCGACGCREMSRRLAPTHTMRSTHTIKSIEAKKKVIRMLCVIMIAFFVCWVPIHVINTVYLYNPEGLYSALGSRGITLLQLLAYMSSCCNPITYCFMNRRFRQACLAIFRCCLPTSGSSTLEAARARRRTQNNSSQDNNARAVRTELEVLESEDCV